MTDNDRPVPPEEPKTVAPSAPQPAAEAAEPEEDPVNLHDSNDDEREAYFEQARAEEDEAEEAEEPESPERRRISSGEDFLASELLLRAQRADPKLRGALTGKILVVLTDKKLHYLYDGSGEQVSVTKLDGAVDTDCVIKVSDKHLLSIFLGKLNPQLAMLSGKVTVEKAAGLAIYFFNLVSPNKFFH